MSIQVFYEPSSSCPSWKKQNSEKGMGEMRLTKMSQTICCRRFRRYLRSKVDSWWAECRHRRHQTSNESSSCLLLPLFMQGVTADYWPADKPAVTDLKQPGLCLASSTIQLSLYPLENARVWYTGLSCCNKVVLRINTNFVTKFKETIEGGFLTGRWILNVTWMGS